MHASGWAVLSIAPTPLVVLANGVVSQIPIGCTGPISSNILKQNTHPVFVACLSKEHGKGDGIDGILNPQSDF